MYWIALLPSREDERTAWGWWALQFTPRVAHADEALLLEISGSERLFGGRNRLLRLIFESNQPLARAQWEQGATSLIALALLRLKLRNETAPSVQPGNLPLDVLTAAGDCVETLSRIGCRTWGDLRGLPRGGVARRFGAGLLEALDAGYGERPEQYPWRVLPEVFDLRFELPAPATSAPELMWSAQRLLSQMQVWLQARNRGVLALELEWTLDLKRLNGRRLPSHEQLVVRTAQPAQDMGHLRRLVAEHLSRAALSAPAGHLRLRSLETTPWVGASKSFLPEDNARGEKLHQLVERLCVRLGEGNVRVPVARQDHRPERKQSWLPARQELPRKTPADPPGAPDALYPTWLLPQPLLLEVHQDVPHYAGGPLRRLARLYRVETGWWEDARPAKRDYFIARSEQAGLVWIYREHAPTIAEGLAKAGTAQVPGAGADASRWYLQGLYA